MAKLNIPAKKAKRKIVKFGKIQVRTILSEYTLHLKNTLGIIVIDHKNVVKEFADKRLV